MKSTCMCALAAVLYGCVQVGPKDIRVPDPAPVLNPLISQKPCTCSLPPIPEIVHISIEPDKPVQADAGGEALLRAYAEVRRK